jgi:hypothetical protein
MRNRVRAKGIEAPRGEFDGEGKLGAKVSGQPHPGGFGKRGCKLLKTKDGSRKKRTKRLQEIEGSRVRTGAAGGVGEVCPR